MIAYGLDFAGFSGGGSALACAELNASGGFDVTIYEGHCFAEEIEGFDEAGEVLRRERVVILECLKHSTLTVDIPIDLQGLPRVEPKQFTWELTLRPADRAFDGLPPFASYIGAPVSRFASLLSPLQHAENHHLVDRLFETYPKETLRRLGLPWKGYKGSARFEEGGWVAVTAEIQPKRNETEDQKRNRIARQKTRGAKNSKLSEVLKELKWSAQLGTILTHDGFDAALCAITGASKPTERIENAALKKEIQERLTHRNRPAPRRFDTPKGYVLLTKKPTGVRIGVRPVSGEDELLSIIRRQAKA